MVSLGIKKITALFAPFNILFQDSQKGFQRMERQLANVQGQSPTFLWMWFERPLPSFIATSIVLMCCYGDRVTNGEARCHLVWAPLVSCKEEKKFYLGLFPVHLKHSLQIKRSRLVVAYIVCFFFFFQIGYTVGLISAALSGPACIPPQPRAHFP